MLSSRHVQASHCLHKRKLNIAKHGLSFWLLLGRIYQKKGQGIKVQMSSCLSWDKGSLERSSQKLLERASRAQGVSSQQISHLDFTQVEAFKVWSYEKISELSPQNQLSEVFHKCLSHHWPHSNLILFLNLPPDPWMLIVAKPSNGAGNPGSFHWFLSRVKSNFVIYWDAFSVYSSGPMAPKEVRGTFQAMDPAPAGNLSIPNRNLSSANLRLDRALFWLLQLSPSHGWDLPIPLQKVPTFSEFSFTGLHSHKALYSLGSTVFSCWTVFYSLHSVYTISLNHVTQMKTDC